MKWGLDTVLPCKTGAGLQQSKHATAAMLLGRSGYAAPTPHKQHSFCT